MVRFLERSNKKIEENIHTFPNYYLRCRLRELLDERGMTLEELSELSGVRAATLSEMINAKRTALYIPAITSICIVLRLKSFAELFEVEMDDETLEKFNADRRIIERDGLTPEQEETIGWKRKEDKLIKQFKKVVRKYERLLPIEEKQELAKRKVELTAIRKKRKKEKEAKEKATSN
jgi:transcriptional regulator with XRE-family HTH domain